MGNPRADEDLLSAFVAGDRRAFDSLVARHQDRLFQFARWFAQESPAAAEDIAQEIWIQVFRSAPSFRRQSSFRTWLYGIGRHVCLGWIRRRSAARAASALSGDEAELLELPDGESPPLESLEREERERLVREAVERLPAHHRVVLLLRNWEEMSYEEIAETLELPLGTVRSRLHNAMAGLSRELQALWKEEAHGLQ